MSSSDSESSSTSDSSDEYWKRRKSPFRRYSSVRGNTRNTHPRRSYFRRHSDDDEESNRGHCSRGNSYRAQNSHERSYRSNSGSRPSYRGQNSNERSYRSNSGGRQSYRGQNSTDGDRFPRHRRRMKMASVNLPNGDRVSVTVPVTSRCTCPKRNTKTKLIPLRPNGKMGQKEYAIVEKEMKATIKQHQLGASGGGQFTGYNIISINKIVNCCLWKRYRNGQNDIAREVGYVNEKMLFHGTAAVDDIVKHGFDERRSNKNGMFGAGIYFAQHSSKSNQYVYGYMGGSGCATHKDKNCYACERKLLLCRVTLGKSESLTSGKKLAHPSPGFHSVQGVPTQGILLGGLKYPEYVIYRGEQAYPEYLITYKIEK